MRMRRILWDDYFILTLAKYSQIQHLVRRTRVGGGWHAVRRQVYFHRGSTWLPVQHCRVDHWHEASAHLADDQRPLSHGTSLPLPQGMYELLKKKKK